MSVAVTFRPDRYPADQDRRTFVVLGAPRGGTSVVAGSMQLLGLPMGAVGDQHEDPAFRPETSLEDKRMVIAVRNAAYRRWGWKRPNTIYYYNEIRSWLVNPVFVAVFRNPLAIMQSAARHDATDLHPGHFQAPFGHYARMATVIRENPAVPVFAFSYEDILARPQEFVRDLARVIGMAPSDETAAGCLRFIGPGGGYRGLSAS